MSHKFTFGIGFAFAIALAGCGSSVNSSTQTVTMQAVGASGQNGTAILLDNGNGTTSVTLATTGGTDSGSQPAHIHTGTCGSNGPVYAALTNVNNGGSQSTVNYTLSTLTGGKYYINIHNSVTNANIQACGQIQ